MSLLPNLRKYFSTPLHPLQAFLAAQIAPLRIEDQVKVISAICAGFPSAFAFEREFLHGLSAIALFSPSQYWDQWPHPDIGIARIRQIYSELPRGFPASPQSAHLPMIEYMVPDDKPVQPGQKVLVVRGLVVTFGTYLGEKLTDGKRDFLLANSLEFRQRESGATQLITSDTDHAPYMLLTVIKHVEWFKAFDFSTRHTEASFANAKQWDRWLSGGVLAALLRKQS